ncbi:MAG: hypothetical protein HY421_03015 [Candidatus Kerfeldbacteria bacterium]|nr:hypothetical protein [Candidatus Kerfeldbacteria bacterium]
MLPYRFEFETDEQYEARTGISLEDVQSAESSSNTDSAVVQPSDHQSTSFFVFPWWTILIALLILVIGAYEFHRRRVAQALRQLGPFSGDNQEAPQRQAESGLSPTGASPSREADVASQLNPPALSTEPGDQLLAPSAGVKPEATDSPSVELPFERHPLPDQAEPDSTLRPSPSRPAVDQPETLSRAKPGRSSRKTRSITAKSSSQKMRRQERRRQGSKS